MGENEFKNSEVVEDLVNAADLRKLKKNLKEIVEEFQSVTIKYIKKISRVFSSNTKAYTDKRGRRSGR